jgi:hypothetical protein
MSLDRYLKNIIEDVISGRMSVVSFCDEFESIFNIEIDKSTLVSNDLRAFSDLFDVVVWYSPFPEERESIPNYVDDRVVLDAAKKAAAALNL